MEQMPCYCVIMNYAVAHTCMSLSVVKKNTSLNFKVLPWDHTTCFTVHTDSNSDTVETQLHFLKRASLGLVRLQF